MYRIDLNSDVGEGYGSYVVGSDSDLIPMVSAVNIACGWHAGDPLIMRKTMEIAKKHGVAIGAHPGYPDLVGFGRRNLQVSPDELKAYVQYQIGALCGLAHSVGVKVTHVKPHGAMYNMAAVDAKLARAIAEGVLEISPELVLYGLSNSELICQAKTVGLKTMSEVFADRAYQRDGTLVPRSQSGAVIHDAQQVIARSIQMIQQGTVQAITGETIEIQADSICVHGDTKEAVQFLEILRKRFFECNIQVISY